MKKEDVPINGLTQFFVCGFAFLLPLNELINTWFLIGLVIISIYQSIHLKLGSFIYSNILLLVVPSMLFLIRIIGTFYSSDFETGIKEVIRASSFLLLPFIFLVLNRVVPKRCNDLVFSSLSIGCLLATLICWASVVIVVVENNEPISNLFTWKRSNAYLTQVIDIHPPYLGALVLTSLVYVFFRYIHRKQFSIMKMLAGVVVIIFVLFLFHLVARNSLLFLLLLSFGYILYFKLWKMFLIGILFLGSFSFFIIEHGNHYLQRKYYKMLDFSDEKIEDKRFDRLEASWNVFIQHPIIGAGMGYVDDMRLIEYRKMKDKLAVDKNFNSHNQYMEYLSTFGVIGFLVFMVVLLFMMKKAISHGQLFLCLLLLLVMFACLTESFLERELGIKYFSLLAGLIACNSSKKQILEQSQL